MTPNQDYDDGPATGSNTLMTDQLAGALAALRRHLRLIIVLPLVALAVSVALSLTAQKQYTATSTVLLLVSNPVNQLLNPASSVTPADPERDLNTEVSQITEAPVLAQVRQRLQLSQSDEALLAMVTPSVEGTTNLVDINVTDSDPTTAAGIANAFANAFVNYRLLISRAAIVQSIDLVKTQLVSSAATGNRAVRAQLESRLHQLQVYSSFQTSDAQISQPATVPKSPSSPAPLRNGVIALVVGLIIALVAAFALDLLDRHVRDEDEAERVSGLHVLTRIPEPTMRARGRNAVNRHSALDIDSEQAEAYRSLAVSVSASIRSDPRSQIVMVTSPGPRDGKTTITLGLAAALASLGLRTIAVEGDLRRPRFGELLGLGSQDGVTSILAGTHELASAGMVQLDFRSLRPTETHLPKAGEPLVPTPERQERTSTVVQAPESRLKVLPAGMRLAQPSAVLAGSDMIDLLVDLRSSADVVLLDTPPIAVVSDAVVLAPLVDHALVVAQLGRTTRASLARTRRIVEENHLGVLGLVLVGGPRGSLSYYG